MSINEVRYLPECGSTNAYVKAVKAKRLENNLNCTIPEELLRALATELEEHGTE